MFLLLAQTAGRQTSFSVSSEGTYMVDNAGNVTFNPVKDFNGNTTAVYYTVTDNGGDVSNFAAINLYITPVDDVQTIFFTVNANRQIVVTCYDKIVSGLKITVYNTGTGRLLASANMKSQTATIKLNYHPLFIPFKLSMVV